jgi:glyoxylase-like metal-dependent hydrolase (beta-lactamase superfamily II)
MAQDSDQSAVATVSVHALSCGHFTLPEHQFVKPSDLEARRTVPSLAFLIQHKNQTGRVTRILFDLGLRRDLKHTENRRPIETNPDVVQNLARGGLRPDDIDYIIYSHVCSTHLLYQLSGS